MEKRVKILLVEDDEIDRMAFERFIERENLPYDYRIAGSVSEARDALAAERFDIALIDYLLDDGTAFDLFDDVGRIPSILITGSGDEEIAVKAMKAGAYDYLIKDPQGNYLTALPLTVENAISRKLAEEAVERYREHLEELVEERTAELQRANKELARANEQLLAEITQRKRAERLLHALDRAALATEQAFRPDEVFAAVTEEFRKVGFSCALFLADESQTRLFPRYLSQEPASRLPRSWWA